MALSLLLTATLSQTGPPQEQDACEQNLTCAHETKTVVIREFSRGPRLSDWNRVARSPEATVFPFPQGRVPQSLCDPVTGIEFVLVPGACYRTDGAGCQPEEVCLDPYYIGADEATFDANDRFAQATDRTLPDDEGWGRGRRPAINVSVYDALSFAKWLSRKSDAHYRLPTEVEWEHAAGAGQPVKYLVRQMKDIRDGRRDNGLFASMRASISNVTDEELEIIAGWLASRWWVPLPDCISR